MITMSCKYTKVQAGEQVYRGVLIDRPRTPRSLRFSTVSNRLPCIILRQPKSRNGIFSTVPRSAPMQLIQIYPAQSIVRASFAAKPKRSYSPCRSTLIEISRLLKFEAKFLEGTSSDYVNELYGRHECGDLVMRQ